MPAADYELGIGERVTLIECDSVEEALATHDGAAYQEALAALDGGAERDTPDRRGLLGAEDARGQHGRRSRVSPQPTAGHRDARWHMRGGEQRVEAARDRGLGGQRHPDHRQIGVGRDHAPAGQPGGRARR